MMEKKKIMVNESRNQESRKKKNQSKFLKTSAYFQFGESMLNFLKKINYGVDKEEPCNTKHSKILMFLK